MRSRSLPRITLISLAIALPACHDPYYDTFYENNYVAPGEYYYINYAFVPDETYRIKLITYTGDADIAVYNEYGELVVFSDEYSTNIDEVIFTASSFNYQIEIYGNLGSDYDLYVEQLPYYDTGLTTNADGIEFNIDSNSFTGEIYSTLASQTFQVNNNFDLLTIYPSPDPIWLDITPTGTVYNTSETNQTTVTVNILETASVAANDYASVIVQAEDYYGKVYVFKAVDIIYRVSH